MKKYEMSAPFQGTWKYGGVEFIDDIIKMEIITTEGMKADRFFKRFKQRLMELLEQVDILITTQDIRTI